MCVAYLRMMYQGYFPVSKFLSVCWKVKRMEKFGEGRGYAPFKSTTKTAARKW